MESRLESVMGPVAWDSMLRDHRGSRLERLDLVSLFHHYRRLQKDLQPSTPGNGPVAFRESIWFPCTSSSAPIALFLGASVSDTPPSALWIAMPCTAVLVAFASFPVAPSLEASLFALWAGRACMAFLFALASFVESAALGGSLYAL